MLIEKYRLVHFTSQYFLSASNEQPTLVIAENWNIKPQNMNQIIVHGWDSPNLKLSYLSI